MAPQNRRIVTLRDIGSNDKTPQQQQQQQNDHDETTAPAASVASAVHPISNPLSAPFCQATTAARTSIPLLYHIAKNVDHLSLAHVCRQTLERVWKEFEPIIRRRGYNVLSISELCCCGDGLDETNRGRGNTARPLRKQPDTVWGYNQTTFKRAAGRGHSATRGSSSSRSTTTTSHTIHLRLRKPRHHATQLLSWEDVAGTMAHELSHCVHQNHSKEFYQLMEEILDEHATIQLQNIGSHILYGFNSASDLSSQGTVEPSLPTSGGYRRGGNNSIASSGKSRLIDGGMGGGGYRLNPSSGPNSQATAPSPRTRREAMARAAEKRRTQMEQLRRMIEASREPCVIEILDDDDDNDYDRGDDDNVGGKYPSYVDDKPKHAKPIATSKKEGTVQGLLPFAIDDDHYIVDMTASTPRVTKKPKATTLQETIDLTSPPNTRMDNLVASASVAMSDAPISCADTIANQEWNCPRCTCDNHPAALVCAMCNEERNIHLEERITVMEGPIEID